MKINFVIQELKTKIMDNGSIVGDCSSKTVEEIFTIIEELRNIKGLEHSGILKIGSDLCNEIDNDLSYSSTIKKFGTERKFIKHALEQESKTLKLSAEELKELKEFVKGFFGMERL